MLTYADMDSSLYIILSARLTAVKTINIIYESKSFVSALRGFVGQWCDVHDF